MFLVNIAYVVLFLLPVATLAFTGSSFGGLYAFISNEATLDDEVIGAPIRNCVPNPLTNGCSCVTGSEPSCGKTSSINLIRRDGHDWQYKQSFEICSCLAPQHSMNQLAFGLLFTIAKPNPANGFMICPSGTSAKSNALVTLCIGDGDPYKTETSYSYGGTYYTSHNNGCNHNNYTMNCSCPFDAPDSFSFSEIVQSVKGGPMDILTTYICYGSRINDLVLNEPNNANSTNTTGTTSSNPGLMNIGILVICIILLLAILSTVYFLFRTRKEEYETVV